MNAHDIAIVGGGIIGLGTAYTLKKHRPDLRIAVLEKEARPGLHQSSRNSGVMHSGIYYKPGSLKAENCLGGKRMLIDFCNQHSIEYRVCGKLLVATAAEEFANLELLYERGKKHGIECRMLEGGQLKEIEPHVAALKGIHIPSVSVINFSDVLQTLERQLSASGIEVKLNAEVLSMQDDGSMFAIETSAGTIKARFLINTAGLYCDRIAKMALGTSPIKIIPFRGEYYELIAEKREYCRGLIYPVPDPRYPFLGVHVTRGLDGTVECGPNAILALAREAYDWRTFSLRDTLDAFSYPGFLKFAARNLGTGLFEVMRSLSKGLFLKSVRRLIPAINAGDLTKGTAGIRAQAITAEGKLVDDFYFQDGKRQIHLLNAPSPAATSVFSIAETIAARYFKGI